jgi:hypothetical protein
MSCKHIRGRKFVQVDILVFTRDLFNLFLGCTTVILKQVLLNSYSISSDHCGASIKEDIYLWPLTAGD